MAGAQNLKDCSFQWFMCFSFVGRGSGEAHGRQRGFQIHLFLEPQSILGNTWNTGPLV